MLEKIKLALRIRHDYLNDEIESIIQSAKLELIRLGIDVDKVESDDELIFTAIRTYCLGQYASDEKTREGYNRSFAYIADCLRKSVDYSNDK